jgi:CDP-6-deoxy-D-xylo-4-hexulose-3-dehydrase
VLLDVETGTYNMSTDCLSEALSAKTKAVFIPHTLGNPNDMGVILDFAEDHDLVLIEDACDALGSKYDGKYLGSFGCLATFSFYPAHQITTGEGGAVVTNDEELSKIVLSLRDWGRACIMPVCNPLGCPDKVCPRSINYKGTAKPNELPEDYDKRYLYTNVGYNFKPTEIQAAMGSAQLRKLPEFIEKRKRNFRVLYDHFRAYEDFFILPESLPESDPCWFAFPLTIKEQAPFSRKDVVQWLTKHNIEAKMVFTGNITKHPAYANLNYRVGQELSNSDLIMRNSFFVGVYPGIGEEQMKYILDVFRDFFNTHKR